MTKEEIVKKWIINFFIFFLLLVGLALIFNNKIKDFFVKNTGEQYAITNVTKEEIKKNNKKEASFDFDAVESMSIESVLRAQLNHTKLSVIGSIAVPSVSINLPIFRGLDNANLLYGAGTLSSDQKMGQGNYALASHRASNPQLLFTPLENLNLGDTIYLVDLENVYTYTSIFKEKVSPTDTQLLNIKEGKKLVTLITCGDMDAVTRLVIQGELKSVTPMKKATKEMKEAFDMITKTL